ncbi:hypothetical protein NC652_008891 [Populus alba x Populus x berolinensis]|nr:hypothetical protein NC652_008891 [Populus alba x Populus x berolinensis]
MILSSQAEWQQAPKIIKGLKGQRRSLLGNDTEEAMQSEEDNYGGSHTGKIETSANLREIPIRVMPLKPLLQAL